MGISVLRMQAPDLADVPGLCALHGLTSVSKPVLEAGFQVLVVLSMVAIWLVVRLSQWVAILCPRRQELSSIELHRGRGYATYEYTEVLSSSGGSTPLTNPLFDASDGTLLSPRARFVTVAINFGLTAYAALTVTSVKLLHCVWVPGTPESERRLFVSGSTICEFSGWQLPLLMLLTGLVALPIVLAIGTHLSLRSSLLSAPVPRPTDIKAGFKRAVVETYSKPLLCWESVLMAQRLVRQRSSAPNPSFMPSLLVARFFPTSLIL